MKEQSNQGLISLRRHMVFLAQVSSFTRRVKLELELKKRDHRPGTDKVEPETKWNLQITTALCYYAVLYHGLQ